jgi:hypothetical protein
MNTPRFVTLSRLVLAAGLVAASAAAQAGGGVYWAVNVDAPVDGMGRISTAVSNTRHGVAVQPAQVYYQQPVVYAPQPVVYAPPPVVWQPRPVYYAPQPVVYQPVRYVEARGPWWWHHRHHHDDDRGEWREERREPMMLPRGGWDDHGRDGGERHHGR